MGCEASVIDSPEKDTKQVVKGRVRKNSSDEVSIKDACNVEMSFEEGKIAGRAFYAKNLSNCTIYISDVIERITIKGCTDCKFALAVCSNMTFITECNKCEFTIVGKQCRIANSNECSLFLHTSQRTFVERSNNIVIGCGTYSYNKIVDHMAAAHLDLYLNNYHQVLDVTPGQSSYEIHEGERSSIQPKDGTKLLPYYYAPSGQHTTIECLEDRWGEIVRISFHTGVKLVGCRKNGRTILAFIEEDPTHLFDSARAQS